MTNRFQKIQDKINALEFYLANEDQSSDVIFEIINKLGSKLSRVVNAEWSSEKELSDFIYNDDDPLDTVDGASDIPEAMHDDVRDIQIDIIREFAPE